MNKLFTFFLTVLFYCIAHAENIVTPLDEIRYCGAVNRDSNNNIVRRSDVTTAFQNIYPCPSTGKRTGACPGWSKDHTIPLACGGCDAVFNMAWIPNKAKNCKDDWCKDRYERKIYGNALTLPHCTRTLVNIN